MNMTAAPAPSSRTPASGRLVPICDVLQEMARRHAQYMIAQMRMQNSSLNDTLEQVRYMGQEEEEEPPPDRHTWFEVIIPIISVLGVIGNVFNLLVLTRRRMLSSMDRLEKSATYGLVALALSDMLFCLSVLPSAFIYNETYIVDEGSLYVLYYLLFGIGFVNLFLMISTWLIVAMSVHRYFVVVYPLHARSRLSTFRTVLVIVLVYLLSTLVTLPHFLHHEIVECKDLARKLQFEYRFRFSERVAEGIVFYVRWVWPVLADFIPIGILAFCNTRLIYELKRATRTRKRTAHGQMIKESNHKVTLTLVIIVLMLLFLVSPSEILRYVNPYESWGHTGHLAASVTNVLQAINFAFNFILYLVVSATFRHTFKSMFTRCRRSRADQAERQTMLTNVHMDKHMTAIDTETSFLGKTCAEYRELGTAAKCLSKGDVNTKILEQ